MVHAAKYDAQSAVTKVKDMHRYFEQAQSKPALTQMEEPQSHIDQHGDDSEAQGNHSGDRLDEHRNAYAKTKSSSREQYTTAPESGHVINEHHFKNAVAVFQSSQRFQTSLQRFRPRIRGDHN